MKLFLLPKKNSLECLLHIMHTKKYVYGYDDILFFENLGHIYGKDTFAK